MRIRKAVIPAAGLGTRFFPASQAIKKELFPIVGPDGIARPLVHYNILELLEAGIEEIAIIVQPGGEQEFIRYFEPPSGSYLRKLEKYPALAAEASSLGVAGDRIRYIAQETQEGYGHAVYQARGFAAAESILLLLGDHLFRAVESSCSRQLMDVAAAVPDHSISAVNPIGPQDLGGYGTIAGRRMLPNPQLIEVTAIVEKPSVEYARTHLRVDGLESDRYLGWFGMHLLAPSIFEVLAEMIRDDVRDAGEFQLTRAQEIQRSRDGYFAFEMTRARRYDFGTPQEWIASLTAFARPGI
jgi:UTP--glucose-1-phosphate uridylyltransferase